MRWAQWSLGVSLMGLSSAPAMAANDCLGPATEVREAGDPEAALALCLAALEDPACEGVRVHLEMLCALTRHDIARRSGGDAWCVARDAYAPLRASASESYAAAARAGFEETDLWCRSPSPVAMEEAKTCPTCVCRTCPVAEPVSHWWWTGPGLGLVVAGGVLVGLAVEQHEAAEDLAAQSAREGGLTIEGYRRLDDAEDNAHLFAGLGGALLGVGAVACITGLVVGLSESEREGPVSFSISPGGGMVRWQFE